MNSVQYEFVTEIFVSLGYLYCIGEYMVCHFMFKWQTLSLDVSDMITPIQWDISHPATHILTLFAILLYICVHKYRDSENFLYL